MKFILISIIALASAQARQVTIEWDTPLEQVTSWRVYANGVLLATASSPQCALTIADTSVSLTVTAVNVNGESLPSAPLVIPAASAPPLVWIQKSTDLINWTNVIQIEYHSKQFIRMEIVPAE